MHVDELGSLFVIIPLRSLAKLDISSGLIWKADVPAHHDIQFLKGGRIMTLIEHVRTTTLAGATCTFLDNSVVVLSKEGQVISATSIYDMIIQSQEVSEILFKRIANKTQSLIEATRNTEIGMLRSMEGAVDPDVQRSVLANLRLCAGSPFDILHCNSISVLKDEDKSPFPIGSVLISIRELDTILIADLQAGAILWSFGSDAVSGQHQASFLPNGNILLFDNGRNRGYSRVIEVEPTHKEIVWEHSRGPTGQFFCPVAGGCEALSNGNVLITDSQNGQAFEVDRVGGIVSTLVLQASAANGRTAVYRVSALEQPMFLESGLLGCEGRIEF